MTTRRVKRKASAGTRKAGRGREIMTVEGLHASFEKIDKRVRDMIDRGKSDSELSCCIRKAWNEQFHRALSAPAVTGMVSHYRAVYSAPGGKRKTRKAQKAQRGGMAPLDWTMGPGTTQAVYGSFPVEMGATPSVVKSLDRFFEDPVSRSCDRTGGYAPPTQAGGGLLGSALMGHMPASVPHNFLETGVSALQGRTIANPAPSPVASHVAGSVYTPRAFDPSPISQITSLSPVYAAY
jgi:hypothetical protein